MDCGGDPETPSRYNYHRLALMPVLGSMDQSTKPFIDLPSDVLFRIFGECDALGILTLSSVRG